MAEPLDAGTGVGGSADATPGGCAEAPAGTPAGPGGHAARARLSDAQVRARLERLDALLALVEQTPGPAGELAVDAVAQLAGVYGEALARALDHTAAAGSPALLDALVRDELIGHLLVLHGIHPEPVGPRVARAVAELRPEVERRGGKLALRGVENGVATVELTLGGCGSSAGEVRAAVREAVLCAAPELTEVTVASSRPAAAPAFVPLAALKAPARAHAAGAAP